MGELSLIPGLNDATDFKITGVSKVINASNAFLGSYYIDIQDFMLGDTYRVVIDPRKSGELTVMIRDAVSGFRREVIDDINQQIRNQDLERLVGRSF